MKKPIWTGQRPTRVGTGYST